MRSQPVLWFIEKVPPAYSTPPGPVPRHVVVVNDVVEVVVVVVVVVNDVVEVVAVVDDVVEVAVVVVTVVVDVLVVEVIVVVVRVVLGTQVSIVKA